MSGNPITRDHITNYIVSLDFKKAGLLGGVDKVDAIAQIYMLTNMYDRHINYELESLEYTLRREYEEKEAQKLWEEGKLSNPEMYPFSVEPSFSKLELVTKEDIIRYIDNLTFRKARLFSGVCKMDVLSHVVIIVNMFDRHMAYELDAIRRSIKAEYTERKNNIST